MSERNNREIGSDPKDRDRNTQDVMREWNHPYSNDRRPWKTKDDNR